MRYHEIIREGSIKSLINQIADQLIPLVDQGVKTVSIDSLIGLVAANYPGMRVDRAMVMDLLTPDNCPLIDKISGNTVYLNVGVEDSESLDDKDKERLQKRIATDANDEARGNQDTEKVEKIAKKSAI